MFKRNKGLISVTVSTAVTRNYVGKTMKFKIPDMKVSVCRQQLDTVPSTVLASGAKLAQHRDNLFYLPTFPDDYSPSLIDKLTVCVHNCFGSVPSLVAIRGRGVPLQEFRINRVQKVGERRPCKMMRTR